MHVAEGKTPFERIVIIHGSGKHTQEYETLEAEETFDTLPPAEFFIQAQEGKGNNKKSLVIIDDFELSNISKKQLGDLSQLFRFISTHHNWSVMISYQSFFDISPIIRKCSNIFILWKPRAKTEIAITASRIHLDKEELQHLMSELILDRWDSITFDFTLNSPYPLRKNVFQEIKYRETS